MVNSVKKTDKKFLFIHIPKTGGTAISKALSLKVDHSTQDDLEKKINLQPSEHFSFAFCRNPWDRFLSLYFYCMQGSKMYPLQNTSNKISFELFCEICSKGLFVGNQYIWFVHFQKQKHFINDNIKFIGRFEQLQKDFDFVCNQIQIPFKQLSKLNTTKHEHYSHYYDRKTRDIVYHLYKEDIKYFKYEFES